MGFQAEMGTAPRKIALFISTLRGGGAQRSLLKLARGLVEAGLDVDLVLTRAAGELIEEVPQGVRIVDLKRPRALLSIFSLRKYLRHEKPAVLFSALGYINIIAILAAKVARAGTKVVISERNTLTESQHQRPNRALLFLIRVLYGQADAIVAVSCGVADDLSAAAGIARDRITVIYNPIITPELEEKAAEAIDHTWFMDPDLFVILGIGRLVPQKDFGLLIDAFHLIAGDLPHLRVVILGEGEERAALEQRIAMYGLDDRVQMPGFVVNPYPFLKKAGLFVLASKYEGLPGVLIEAMYFGLPLISTDCRSGPGEILMNGKYGLLVPVGDADELAAAIHIAVAGSIPEIAPEAWARFELGSVVSRYLDVFGFTTTQTIE